MKSSSNIRNESLQYDGNCPDIIFDELCKLSESAVKLEDISCTDHVDL